MRGFWDIFTVSIFFVGLALVTGCQSTANTQAEPIATPPILPDFSPERGEREAAFFEPLKSKPDFTSIDVVAIVPTDNQ